MFGLFRGKALDKEKCVEKVTDAILDLWADEANFNLSKFNNIDQFESRIQADSTVINKFQIKKLELISSVAYTLLKKEDSLELFNSITEQTLLLIKDLLKQEVALKTPDLLERATRIATLRFSTNPKEAGQLIENDFTNFVFDFQPEQNDIDSRYLLYKQLSGLERAAIFSIGSAIRKSKV